MIIKGGHYSNRDGSMCLYYSFLYPYLTYCNHIWGSPYKTNLRWQVVLQKKVLCIILYAKSRNNAQLLYKEMKLENVNKYLIGHVLNNYNCFPVQSVSHYNDIMGAMAFQITSRTIVYSTVYSHADQRKHQSSASLAFVRGIHRSPVNSPHKWPVTRKMFPFADIIMNPESVLMLGGRQQSLDF